MTRSPPISRVERLLVVLLSSGVLPDFIARSVRRRIRRSPGASAAYQLLVQAEQIHSGLEVTHAQQRNLEAAVFGSLPTGAPSAARSLVGPWRLAALGSAAAAAAFVLLPAVGDGDLRARGLGTGTLGITVRCLDAAPSLQILSQVAAGPGQQSRQLACPRDALLSFSFTNTTARPVHAMVVGVTRDDELRWYAPFTADARSVVVAPGSADTPVETAADLQPMPADEQVVLRVIFADDAIEAESVAAVVTQTRQRRLSPSRIDRLPVAGTLEARVNLAVTADRKTAR